MWDGQINHTAEMWILKLEHTHTQPDIRQSCMTNCRWGKAQDWNYCCDIVCAYKKAAGKFCLTGRHPVHGLDDQAPLVDDDAPVHVVLQHLALQQVQHWDDGGAVQCVLGPIGGRQSEKFTSVRLSERDYKRQVYQECQSVKALIVIVPEICVVWKV